jgi:predicted  nucleic acid-binding Zn-ribbon protein
MTNENEALRRTNDAMKRIEALEDNLASALRRINALEDLVWDASADIDELAVSLGEPSA